MPRIHGTTDRQTTFLRALRKHGDQLPPEQWPNALVLRRWMRHKGFRRALLSLRQTMRFRTDLQLLGAAASAATALQAKLLPTAAGDGAAPARDVAPAALLALLKFTRQRGVADFEPEVDDRATFLKQRRRALRERERQARLDKMCSRF